MSCSAVLLLLSCGRYKTAAGLFTVARHPPINLRRQLGVAAGPPPDQSARAPHLQPATSSSINSDKNRSCCKAASNCCAYCAELAVTNTRCCSKMCPTLVHTVQSSQWQTEAAAQSCVQLLCVQCRAGTAGQHMLQHVDATDVGGFLGETSHQTMEQVSTATTLHTCCAVPADAALAL